MQRFERLYVIECVIAAGVNFVSAILFVLQIAIAQRSPPTRERPPVHNTKKVKPIAIAAPGAAGAAASPNHHGVGRASVRAPTSKLAPSSNVPTPPRTGGGGGGGTGGGAQPLQYYHARIGLVMALTASLLGVDVRGSQGRMPTWFLTAVASTVIACILACGAFWMRATMHALAGMLKREPWHALMRAQLYSVAVYWVLAVGGYSVVGPLLDRGWCVCFDNLAFAAFYVFGTCSQLALYALIRRELTRFVAATTATSSSVPMDTTHIRTALRRMLWFIVVFAVAGTFCTAAWVRDCADWLVNKPDAPRPGAFALDDDYPVSSGAITWLMTPIIGFVLWYCWLPLSTPACCRRSNSGSNSDDATPTITIALAPASAAPGPEPQTASAPATKYALAP